MPNDLRKTPPTLIRVVVLAALMASCVPQDEAPNLRVFAAASTRNVLESAQRTCNIPITFQFAGSQTLKLQLQHGAQADLFISANAHHIDELHRSGLVDRPRPFARNALTIALGHGLTPEQSHTDTIAKARTIALGIHVSPIGLYTETWLRHQIDTKVTIDEALLRSRVVSYDKNSRQLTQRINRGDAELAIIYQSDARAFPHLRTQAIPQDEQPPIKFYYATLTNRKSPSTIVEAFEDCVASQDFLAILREQGFEPI